MAKKRDTSDLIKNLPGWKESMENLRRTCKKMDECEARGHPYKREDISFYHPSSSYIPTVCTNCGKPLERRATAEDIKPYTDLANVVFTI